MTQIFNPTGELIIPIGIENEARVEIECIQ